MKVKLAQWTYSQNGKNDLSFSCLNCYSGDSGGRRGIRNGVAMAWRRRVHYARCMFHSLPGGVAHVTRVVRISRVNGNTQALISSLD